MYYLNHLPSFLDNVSITTAFNKISTLIFPKDLLDYLISYNEKIKDYRGT